MKLKFRVLTSSAVVVTGLLGAGLPAHAEPAGTGWDNNPDVVVGGGSDTTYNVMQRLETLYNGAPGCLVSTANDANKGLCAAPTAVTPDQGNFDHDLFVGAAPTGSSAGVNALLSTGAANRPAIAYARSSRGPNAGETNELTFWGYARDAIAVVSFGSRAGISLTQAQLVGIFTCNPAFDTWGEVLGTADTSPVIPWDMNSASGTRSSFVSFLGGVTFGSCVRKLTTGTAPFENDVKPVLADVGPDTAAGTADDDENNYIWWMSYGAWVTYPYVKNAGTGPGNAGPVVNSNLVSVGGTLPSAANINSGTYPIVRTVYHVTKNVDVDCAGAAGSTCGTGPETVGSDTGVGGAVREFTEFLCRPTTTAVNPITGVNYRTEVIRALNAEGFQQIPTASGLRTAGYACQIQT